MINNNGIIDISTFLNKGYNEISQIERLPGEGITDFDFPTNKWKIIEHKYKYTGEEKYWNICSYDILKYNEESSEFKMYMTFGRNYHSLGRDLIAYVIQNNKEFLITSSNYQYLTILNLTDKEIKSYSYGSPDIGAGFCPISIQYFQSSNNNLDNELKVFGCFWGAPHEILIIKNIDLNDLSNSYNIQNEDILRIDDEDDEEYHDPEELLEKSDINIHDTLITEIDLYDIIKDEILTGHYKELTDEAQKSFEKIIMKCICYYYDNHF